MEKKESKGKMSRSEAGHLGGEKVKEEKGPGFYKEIGHKGGEHSHMAMGKKSEK